MADDWRDPAIRWQTMQGLLNEPAAIYEAERLRTSTEGWGARLLAFQTADGLWGGGVYSPKWISTTYTLLLPRHIGLPPEHPQALRGCEHFLVNELEKDGGTKVFRYGKSRKAKLLE